MELTKRQRELMPLICQGLTYDQIGKELFLSTSTVKTLVKSMFERLNVHTRVELAVWWTRQEMWELFLSKMEGLGPGFTQMTEAVDAAGRE